MSAGGDNLTTIHDALGKQLAHCAALVEQASDDDALLALRDLLLDYQFESRQAITAIEERLGAFSGDDSPRALAANAEGLIETIEGLQDAWESRTNRLLAAGFAEGEVAAFLDDALNDREGRALLDEFFTGLPSDMDQTALLLDYAKRYLLALLERQESR